MRGSWYQSNSEKKLTNDKSERLQDNLRQQYEKANNQVKKMVRADRRFYADNVATQTEEAAAKEELGVIFKIIKIVCGKHRNKLKPPIKDRGGKLLTSEREQKKPWAEQ